MRKISVIQGKELASRYHCIYKETSSIENPNIFDIFRIIMENIYRKIKERINNNNIILLNRNHNSNNNDINRRCFKCC